MAIKDCKNCWDFWKCPVDRKENCHAYKADLGDKCWIVVGHPVGLSNKCPKLINNFKSCFECPWFKKMNPDLA